MKIKKYDSIMVSTLLTIVIIIISMILIQSLLNKNRLIISNPLKTEKHLNLSEEYEKNKYVKYYYTEKADKEVEKKYHKIKKNEVEEIKKYLNSFKNTIENERINEFDLNINNVKENDYVKNAKFETNNLESIYEYCVIYYYSMENHILYYMEYKI